MNYSEKYIWEFAKSGERGKRKSKGFQYLTNWRSRKTGFGIVSLLETSLWLTSHKALSCTRIKLSIVMQPASFYANYLKPEGSLPGLWVSTLAWQTGRLYTSTSSYQLLGSSFQFPVSTRDRTIPLVLRTCRSRTRMLIAAIATI